MGLALLLLLRHGVGPGLDHLLRLCHDRVPDHLLLRHDNHYCRGCEAFADGAEHLGLVRLKQRRYNGADDMYARVLQACWTWLLLIGARRDKEGKGGWEERYAALLELAREAGPERRSRGVLRGGPVGAA